MERTQLDEEFAARVILVLSMFQKLGEDVFSYLKRRWWGRPLIVLVIVAAGVFYLWNSLTANQKESLLRFGGSPAPGNTSRSGTDNGTKQFTEEELVYRNLVIYTCQGTLEPRKRYELARDLEPSDRREAEMANVVMDAVCAGDEPYALEIFARLNASDHKDRAARQVAAFYIEKKKFDDAKRWVEFLSNPQDKGWWVRRILEVSSHSK